MQTRRPRTDVKRLTLPFVELKMSAEGNGGFAGYGSTFGNTDRQNEIVKSGAFAKAIPGFLADGFIAWGHDWDGEPVAYPTAAREDERGLYIEASFHGTPKAQAARQIASERLAAGKSMGLSIGFKVAPGGTSTDEKGIRSIHEIAWLAETSIVLAPANEAAGITGIKSGSDTGEKAVDGSYEAIGEDVLAMALEAIGASQPPPAMGMGGMASMPPMGHVVATFPSYVVICVMSAGDMGDMEEEFYSVPYVVDGAGAVTIGAMTPVEQTYTPKSMTELATKAVESEQFAAQFARVLGELTTVTRLLDDLDALTTRAAGIADVRQKAGRQFSAANVDKLSQMADAAMTHGHAMVAHGQGIHDMLAAATDTGKATPHAATETLRLRTETERLLMRVRARGAEVA